MDKNRIEIEGSKANHFRHNDRLVRINGRLSYAVHRIERPAFRLEKVVVIGNSPGEADEKVGEYMERYKVPGPVVFL